MEAKPLHPEAVATLEVAIDPEVGHHACVMKAIAPGTICLLGAALLSLPHLAGAQDSPKTTEDFSKYAEKLRESAILHMQPQVIVPGLSRPPGVSGKYPWKTQIVTTVFWIGHSPKEKDGNTASAWDPNWERNYGGYDNPEASARRNFIPINFVPRQNPFYIALPYNDVTRNATKPEARVVIPWFRDAVANGNWVEGQSVCRDRWVAIRNAAGKVCYAQWSDCGPFRIDHWQYVFGNEKPTPNANAGAGLNVSPAVRDYLELSGTDVTDWKFVEVQDVPKGPWALYGDNNSALQTIRSNEHRSVGAPVPPRPPSSPPPASPPSAEEPTIIERRQQ